MSTITVTLDEIEATSKQALINHAAAEWVAAEVARAIRRAEETNNLICGLYYLESYCKQLRTGRVNGLSEPLVSRPKLACVKVDAEMGFAQPAFTRGLPEAINMVKETGSGTLAVCHAHTCTSLGYFTEQIAQAGLIGIGFTNASAVVSPPGGKKAVLGTNPIAMSVPAKTGGVAFQFDQSTSAVALGKITMAASANESIPLGWAIDSDGEPTTDPHAALKGSLVSTGGYKGYGFGLMAEVLAAAVTGSTVSTDVKGLKLPEGNPHNLGQFYFLQDPSVYSGEGFWDRLEQLSASVAEQPNARLPGSKPLQKTAVNIGTEIWSLTQQLANDKP